MLEKKQLQYEQYLPLKNSECLSKFEILKITKKLIKNSENYNLFCKSFKNSTQALTFKLPEIKFYPVFNRKDLIPVSRLFYDVSYDSSNTKITHYLRNKSTSESTPNIFNFKKKNEKIHLKNTQSSNITCSNNLSRKFSHHTNELEIFELDANLSYDPNVIFNKLEFCKDLIMSKISYFKTTINENMTTILTKKFNKEIILTLNSIMISFFNMAEKNTKPISFLLPLSLLPIFYFNDVHAIKIILLKIIKFDENFEEINLNDEGIYKILKNNNLFNLAKDDTNKKFSVLKNKENIFIFNWITPKYPFEVEVRLPEILFEMPHKNIKITKFIDPELLFYIYNLNFNQWYFYVSNYLVCFKEFRNLVNKASSKTIEFSNLKESHINMNLNVFTDEIKINCGSQNETTFVYFVTIKEDNKIKNHLHIINSFVLKAEDESKNKTHKFSFNLTQMKILNRIAEDIDINSFIKKILIQEYKDSILIDYNFFNNLDESYFNLIKSSKIFEKENVHQTKNGFILETIWPSLEKHYVSNGVLIKENLGYLFLQKSFLEKICKSEIEGWGKIILEEAPWSKVKKATPKSDKVLLNSPQINPRRRSFIPNAFIKYPVPNDKFMNLFKGMQKLVVPEYKIVLKE